MGLKPRSGKAITELDTSAVIGTSAANAIALGGRDLDGVALFDPKEVFYLNFQYAYDVWTSENETAYVCSWRDDPLFSYRNGSWAIVDIDLPSADEHTRILHVAGVSGQTPALDELYCVATPYHARTHHNTLLRRHAGHWSEIPLPDGRPWELATSPDGAVIISLGGEAPALLRVKDGTIERIAPPSAAAMHRAVGVCAGADGALLACFAAPKHEAAMPWILRDGNWKPLRCSTPLWGFGAGGVDSLTWAGQIYLAANRGLYRITSEDELVLDSPFRPRRLFSVGDALVCSGYRDGSYGHMIERGDGWEPLTIPNPERVRGARGSMVVLAPRRKMRRRRVRMKRPEKEQTPVLVSTHSDYCQKWLQERVFDGRSERRQAPLTVADDLVQHLGIELSAPLRRYLELYSQYASARSFGGLSIWNPEDLAPPSREPTLEKLASGVFRLQPTIIAALTNTMYLGTDAGGQVYFVEASSERSEVYLYDPGQGTMDLLADSLDSFMFLNDLAQQWHDYARASDLDYEDVEDGNVDKAAPEVQRIATGMASLENRVNLDEDSDVISEFHELLPMLTNDRPLARPQGPTDRLFARAQWLLALFREIEVDISQAATFDFKADMADATLAHLAATRVYWLWHLYLFDDPRLAQFIGSLESDTSSLVRGTARLIAELSSKQPAAHFEIFDRYRREVRSARANHTLG